MKQKSKQRKRKHTQPTQKRRTLKLHSKIIKGRNMDSRFNRTGSLFESTKDKEST